MQKSSTLASKSVLARSRPPEFHRTHDSTLPDSSCCRSRGGPKVNRAPFCESAQNICTHKSKRSAHLKKFVEKENNFHNLLKAWKTVGASLVVPRGLQGTHFRSCGSWAPERRLSTCGYGLSCSAARGIFPARAWNPCPLHWQEDS